MWGHVSRNSFKLDVLLHAHDKGEVGNMAFEKPLLISVKNIDLRSGLEIIESLSEHVPVSEVIIRRSSKHV